MSRFTNLVSVLTFICGVNAFAQSTLTTNIKSKNSKTQKKTFSSWNNLSYETNLREESDGEKTKTANFWTINSLELEDSSQIRLSLMGEKSFVHEYESDLGDGFIGWAKGIQLSDSFSFSHDYRLNIPMSEETRKNQSKNTGITLAPSFSLDLEKAANLNGLSLTYKPFITKNFHRYETAKTGTSNTSYSATHLLAVGMKLSDKFSVGFSNFYIQGWTYENNRKVDAFWYVQSLNYQVTKNLELSLSHSNQGTIYGTDGVEESIELADRRTSTVSFGLTATY